MVEHLLDTFPGVYSWVLSLKAYFSSVQTKRCSVTFVSWPVWPSCSTVSTLMKHYLTGKARGGHLDRSQGCPTGLALKGGNNSLSAAEFRSLQWPYLSSPHDHTTPLVRCQVLLLSPSQDDIPTFYNHLGRREAMWSLGLGQKRLLFSYTKSVLLYSLFQYYLVRGHYAILTKTLVSDYCIHLALLVKRHLCETI